MHSNLPPEWRMVRLGQCLRRRNETVMPAILSDAVINVVGLEDIEDNGRGGVRIQKTKPQDIKSLKTVFQAGDILYGKLRPYLNKVAIVHEGGVCSTEIWSFEAADYVIPFYIYAFLSSAFFIGRVSSLTKGANLPRLDLEDFQSIEVPIPPLGEQKVIVEILQETENVRRLNARAQEAIVDVIPLIFKRTFLQAENKKGWDEVTVEEMAENKENAIRTGPFGSDLLHSEFVDQGIPVIGIDNAVENRFRWAERRYITQAKYQDLKRFQVFPGDVMVTIMGTVGRVAVAPPDLPKSISTKHLCVITPDQTKVLPQFLWATLLYDPFVRAQTKAVGKGAIMEGWNSKIIRGLRFRLPPLPLQREFVSVLQQFFETEDKLPIAGRNVSELSDSILAQAFTGQLTAAWRERHKAQLERESAERDAAFQAAGVTFGKPLRAETVKARYVRRTDGAYAELNREQHTVLEALAGAESRPEPRRWFTVDEIAHNLTGALHGNRHAIEAHLALLAERGLVIAASLEQRLPGSGEVVYGNAYRQPVDQAEPQDGEEPEGLAGDRVRLAEMQRLAEQLRQGQTA